MIRNRTALEVKIGERTYQLYCDSESPLGELHDALSSMKSYVINLISEHHQKENPKSEGP